MAPFALNAEDGEISASTEGATALTLYFPNQSASLNVPVTRYVEDGASIETAMRALIEGPQSDALRCCFPEGTELISQTCLMALQRWMSVRSSFQRNIRRPR